MADPTPEEIVQIAKSGSTGQVKTLTDIRFEKYEARIADLESKYAAVIQLNEEYRSANAEMFAYIQSQSKAPQAQVSPTISPAPGVPQAVAAQVIKDDSAEIAAKQREEANLQAVLETMGYRKPASQSNIDTTITQDGM